jgi:hypothetical protein
MIKRRREAPKGPPAIYSFPSQYEATEITSTNVYMKATTMFPVSVFIHLLFSVFFLIL